MLRATLNEPDSKLTPRDLKWIKENLSQVKFFFKLFFNQNIKRPSIKLLDSPIRDLTMSRPSPICTTKYIAKTLYSTYAIGVEILLQPYFPFNQTLKNAILQKCWLHLKPFLKCIILCSYIHMPVNAT